MEVASGRTTRTKVKADPGTRRARAAAKGAKAQEEKQEYLEIKRRLLEREKDNYTQLMLMKGKGGWWMMFGHSAIMYKYMVAKRLRLSVKLLPDSDYGVKSDEGCVSVRDLNKLEQRLKPARIYPIKITPKAAIFDLGERVSEQDYALMVREDEISLEMANRLILPEEHMTELNTKTKAAHKVIHEAVRKMDGVSREVFADEMERAVVRLQVMVLRTARGTMDVDECLAEAYDVTEDLYVYTMIMLNLRMLEAKKIYDIAEAVVAL